MQNKKTVNIFINLLIFLFITIFFLNNILTVFSNERIKYNINENVDISISVLYNEKTSQDIYVDSINLSINQNIRKILSIMVLTKKILNFNILDNNIESIKSIEGLEYGNIANKSRWYFYLNETEINSVNEPISIKKDDKIYIKYITIEDESSSNSSSASIESSSILDDDISLPETSNSYSEESLEDTKPSSSSSYYNEYKYSYKENNNLQWTMDISNIFLTSLSWIENSSSLNIDDILAIAISGGNLKHKDISRITSIIIEKNGKYNSIIDLAKDILFVTFTGGNPYNINEINLIDMIYSFDNINIDGIEGLLYFLIAIHSGNYINPKGNSNEIIFHIIELIKQSEEFLNSDKFLHDSLLIDNMEKLSLFSIALNKHIDDIEINEFLINIYKFLYSNSYKIMSISNKNQNSVIISNMIISVISLETNLKILDSDKINKLQLVNYLTDNFYTNKGFSYLRKQNIDKFSTIMAIKALSSFKNNSNLYILKANINNNNDNIIYKKNGLYINIHFLNSLLIIIYLFIYIYIIIKKIYRGNLR